MGAVIIYGREKGHRYWGGGRVMKKQHLIMRRITKTLGPLRGRVMKSLFISYMYKFPQFQNPYFQFPHLLGDMFIYICVLEEGLEGYFGCCITLHAPFKYTRITCHRAMAYMSGTLVLVIMP